MRSSDHGGTERGDAVTGAPPAAPQEEWREVVGRKAGRAARKKVKEGEGGPPAREAPPPPSGGRGPPPPAKPRKASTGKKAPVMGKGKGKVRGGLPGQLRIPTTAAVTIPCGGADRPTEVEVMRRVRQDIPPSALEDMGITTLRMKRSVTGGILLEIPGEGATQKAGLLADRVQESVNALGAGIVVGVPRKRVELRVSRVDLSLKEFEVVLALLSAGGGKGRDIDGGPLKRAPDGLGAMWCRATVEVAQRLMQLGEVRVGLTMARVTLLEPRPLQCHRCLGFGHVQTHCPGGVDRRELCYRCGERGHLAQLCTAIPRCPLCTEAGRKADHRMGAPTCGALPAKGTKARSAPRRGPRRRLEVQEPGRPEVRTTREDSGAGLAPARVEGTGQTPPPSSEEPLPPALPKTGTGRRDWAAYFRERREEADQGHADPPPNWGDVPWMEDVDASGMDAD